MMNPDAVDSGYEPWARAAVDRGRGLTPEMGRELLNKLDAARVAAGSWMEEATALRLRVAELELQLANADMTLRRLEAEFCDAVGYAPGRL